ncbi:hypothetical protein [Paenibacillus sp. MMS18-CY102]|uniref:hypothetical protein n=1 Tax=Paenibacillus sp. MMS18-CY102 TaxID=2682849 RepID=UPI0013661690|nr:hypothetical protein [Paenibacillus sp. MMS18-CY102]MWC27580.1 hypothetical protein [Paenibacillus sp. MMS18-CY102]
MKIMKKRLIYLAVLLGLAVTLLPVQVFASNAKTAPPLGVFAPYTVFSPDFDLFRKGTRLPHLSREPESKYMG